MDTIQIYSIGLFGEKALLDVGTDTSISRNSYKVSAMPTRRHYNGK
jgi:hypothetical protein